MQPRIAVSGADGPVGAGYGIELLNLGGDVVKTFGPEEITVSGPPRVALQHKMTEQFRVRGPCVETENPAASLAIESRAHSQRFQQRWFARSIFPDEKCDCLVQLQPLQSAHRGDGEGIPAK